jgi:hypothetical protein
MVMRAHRGPPLKLWYQTPGWIAAPQLTTVGSIAFTRTSANASVGVVSASATHKRLALKHLASHTFPEALMVETLTGDIPPNQRANYTHEEAGRSLPWLGNDHFSRLYAGWPFQVPNFDAVTVATAACPSLTD